MSSETGPLSDGERALEGTTHESIDEIIDCPVCVYDGEGDE